MSLPILAPTLQDSSKPMPGRCRPRSADRSAAGGPRRRAHAIDLLLHGDLGARTGLRAADIEEIGPLDDQLLGLAEELIEGPVLATVEERIRRAIEDSHHECTRRDVETGGAELDEHRFRP